MEDEIDLLQYLKVLWGRRRIVAAVTLAATLAAVVFSYFSPSIYEAKAMLLVTKPSLQIGGAPDVVGPKIGSVLVSDLPVETLVAFAKSLPMTRKVGEFISRVGTQGSQMPEMLNAQVIRNTSLVELRVKGKDPQRAAKIADAWAAIVVTESKSLFSTAAQESYMFFDGRLQEARSEMEKAEEALREFNATSKIGILQARLSAITSQIASYQSRLTDLSVTLERTKTELAQTEVQISQQSRTLALSKSITTDPFLQQSASEATNADFIELSKLNIRNEELNPVYVNLEQSRNTLIIQLAALRSERAKLTQAWIQLNTELADLRGQLATQQQKQTQLVRAVENSKQVFDVLLQRREEARLASASQVGTVKLVANAVVPDSPVGPRRLFNIALSSVLGLMAGVMVAFVLEYFGSIPIGPAASPVETRPNPSHGEGA